VDTGMLFVESGVLFVDTGMLFVDSGMLFVDTGMFLWTLECFFSPQISVVLLFKGVESCTVRWQCESFLEQNKMHDVMSE
jgi:hypothetical protein